MKRLLPALALAGCASSAPPLTEAQMRRMVDEAIAARAACPQATLTPGPGWYSPVYSAALPSESGTCVVEGGTVECGPAREKSR